MGYSDSATGYTYEFYVYTKKTNEVYPNGFGYHVVMKLMQPMLNQDYVDKIYTSVTLLVDLYAQNTPACDRET